MPHKAVLLSGELLVNGKYVHAPQQSRTFLTVEGFLA